MTYLPTPPETVARMRHLVETTILSQVAIAREVGVSRTTVSTLINKHGWTRPPGAPGGRGPRRAADLPEEAIPKDLPGLIARCLRLLERQIPALGRSAGASRTRTLRAVAETGRTLKELSRIAATLGGPDRAAPEIAPDELDDARFLALCEDLAVRFERWKERGARPFSPGRAGAPGSDRA